MAASARMSDVAKLAGVSIMTVSRVLNDNPNVTASTRKKVTAAVDQLRYQPNEVARSLREKRSRQIGIIVPYLSDPFFAVLAHAISTVAKEHSYSVVLSTSNEDPATELAEASRMLRRNVEGLIVIPAHAGENGSLLLSEEFSSTAIVTLDRPVEGSRFDSVLVENELGARTGTEHLLSLGHTRIAYLGLTNDLYTMEKRHRGYFSAMAAAKHAAQQVFIPGTLASAQAALRKLLASKNPPTALFCANNLLTRHALHSLQQMGLHPPETIALVGFDDFETADLMRPGITVVRQPNEELGKVAADLLFTRLDPAARPRPAKQMVLPVELIVRGSCGSTAG